MLWQDRYSSSAKVAGTSAAQPRPKGRWSWVVVTILMLLISGCAAGQIAQTANQVAAIDGANGTIGHLGVRNGLLAPPTGSDYPKGADAPLWVWISNEGTGSDTLTGITTPAATSVQLVGDQTIPGQTLRDFSGDDARFTLKGLTANISFGVSVPITFTFATAGSVTINVSIQIPQQRTPGRTRYDIQPSRVPSIWDPEESADAGTTAPSSQG